MMEYLHRVSGNALQYGGALPMRVGFVTLCPHHGLGI